MKAGLNQGRTVRASVLLMAMGVIAILGLALASYLTLARWQHVSIVRSQAWNAAIAMAEGGVEEALAQLNPGALMIYSTNIDRGANGWSLGADGMYHAPRRTLPDGYYDVAITAAAIPTIYATGYVTIPTLSATISRSVSVDADTYSVFRGSMAARVNVDLKGNDVATDSFDSMDPLHSTNGLYYLPWRKANGDIASAGGLINVKNANVMGTLYTSPAGSAYVGPNGSVGDVAWVSAPTPGIQAGHYKNDFNMDFPPVQPPFATGFTPGSGTVNGTNYTWVLGNNNYMVDNGKTDLKFTTGDTILVSGRARVYVTGDFLMQGSSQIIIQPGGSLELFVAGANTAITKVNNGGNCATFSYFGLPSNTSVQLSGNDVFLGTIYAPSADLKLSGGGSFNLDYQGAIAVNNIGMNGHFNFHFDENLKRKGPVRGYRITSWREI